MTKIDNGARKAWSKPSVTAVTPLSKTRAGTNPSPGGEPVLYNPVS